tara:strand:+ start:127 stop:327 length:201 start_codon:yes stop_codon:yes gene_type:complete
MLRRSYYKGGQMPYKVCKVGSKWAVVAKATGKVKGRSDTKAKADASARILNAPYYNGSKQKSAKKY